MIHHRDVPHLRSQLQTWATSCEAEAGCRSNQSKLGTEAQPSGRTGQDHFPDSTTACLHDSNLPVSDRPKMVQANSKTFCYTPTLPPTLLPTLQPKLGSKKGSSGCRSDICSKYGNECRDIRRLRSERSPYHCTLPDTWRHPKRICRGRKGLVRYKRCR